VKSAKVLKERKKKKFRKVYLCLAAVLVILVIVVLLLFHRPADYNLPQANPAGKEAGKISRYLTHELLPNLYNGAQSHEPFDLVVTQEGINDAVGLSKWPKHAEGINFSAPLVFFTEDGIVLMATMTAGEAELVLTIRIEPVFDQQGLVNLGVTKVMVGAVNVTAFARIFLKNIYLENDSGRGPADEGIEEKIIRSLLNDEPFEPVFDIDGQRLRIEKITIEQGKLTLQLVPIGGPDTVVE